MLDNLVRLVKNMSLDEKGFNVNLEKTEADEN